MPISKHFKGHGTEVMKSMEKTYPDKETAERVFYATENKMKKKEDSPVKSSMKRVMKGKK
jgi:hypothetical protein